MPAPIGNKFWMERSISGVPKALSVDTMLDYFIKYVKHTKDNPIEVQDFVGKDATEVWRKKEQPLTMEGFEDYVAESGGPFSLAQYFSNYQGRYEDFVTICTFIRRKIRADQIKGGMAGIYNASITQRLNGLAEKTEQKVTTQTAEVDLTALDEETLQKLRAAKLISDGSEDQY